MGSSVPLSRRETHRQLKQPGPGTAWGSLGCGSSGVTLICIQLLSGSASSRPSSCAWLSARYRPEAFLSPDAAGGLHSRTRCPSRASSAEAGRLGAHALFNLGLRGALWNLDVELNQELHGLHLLLLSLGELLAALDVLGREGGEEPGCHAGPAPGATRWSATTPPTRRRRRRRTGDCSARTAPTRRSAPRCRRDRPTAG